MADEYTPTTSGVREVWIEIQDTTHGEGDEFHGAEFDRWLAQHDAEVAAKAQLDLLGDLLAKGLEDVRYTLNDYPIQAVPKSLLLEHRNRITREARS